MAIEEGVQRALSQVVRQAGARAHGNDTDHGTERMGGSGGWVMDSDLNDEKHGKLSN